MLLLSAVAILSIGIAWGQTGTPAPAGVSTASSGPEDFKIYSDHPRLLLPARRLRLVRREAERKSIRWQQFQTVMSSKVELPEPGFANALYYAASQDEVYGKLAVKWAVGPGNDARQLALVFDWCFPILSDSDKKLISGKLQRLLDRDKTDSVTAVRNRVFGAVALADYIPDLPERLLKTFWTDWWMTKTVPNLRKNRLAVPMTDGYALMEIMHAVKDNFNFDMRDNALTFFKDFPAHRILNYYPAVFPGPDATYRIPQYSGLGEPSVNDAIMCRAADLAIVGFDANAVEHQFVQGWLIQDRYIMRGPIGVPYEFLWANPYQPGLSYFHMPLFYHDPKSGVLLMRSTWEEDATWLSYAGGGQIELFMDGRRSGLRPAALSDPLPIGDHLVMMGQKEMKWSLNLTGNTKYFLIGLKPNTWYEYEVDDEELRDDRSDAGGILVLSFPASANVGIRLKESLFQK